MAKPGTDQTTIQAHAWDSNLGKFVPTGEIIEAQTGELDHVEIVRSGIDNRFLKGPVPWKWIVRAFQLRGKALLLGLCLWRLRGATGRSTVWLSNSELKPFGIDRAAKSRGLAALEKAGLVAVNREAGRWPIITLLT